MSVKTIFNDDIHRFNLPAVDFSALDRALRTAYGDQAYCVRYMDEDNDLISISSNVELEEAFRVANGSTLKLFISLPAQTTKLEIEARSDTDEQEFVNVAVKVRNEPEGVSTTETTEREPETEASEAELSEQVEEQQRMDNPPQAKDDQSQVQNAELPSNAEAVEEPRMEVLEPTEEEITRDEGPCNQPVSPIEASLPSAKPREEDNEESKEPDPEGLLAGLRQLILNPDVASALPAVFRCAMVTLVEVKSMSGVTNHERARLVVQSVIEHEALHGQSMVQALAERYHTMAVSFAEQIVATLTPSTLQLLTKVKDSFVFKPETLLPLLGPWNGSDVELDLGAFDLQSLGLEVADIESLFEAVSQEVGQAPVQLAFKCESPDGGLSDVVHHRIRCDGCGVYPIVGVRYQCTVRNDYDLCEACEAKESPQYCMIKHKTVADIRPVHMGIVCDGCNMNPIRGVRYTSAWCPDYDLCETCEATPGIHPANHPLIKVKIPGTLPSRRASAPSAAQTPRWARAWTTPSRPSGSKSHNRKTDKALKKERKKEHKAELRAEKERQRKEKQAKKQQLKKERKEEKKIKLKRQSSQRDLFEDKRTDSPREERKSDVLESGFVLPPAEKSDKSDARSEEVKSDGPDRKVEEEEDNSESVQDCDTSSTSDTHGLRATFVEDITLPDGYVVTCGEALTKTWRMQNNGALPWPHKTKLIFINGESDLLAHEEGVTLIGDTAPFATRDISVPLTAPSRPGNYVAHFQLADPQGKVFGARVWVDVSVIDLEIEQPVLVMDAPLDHKEEQKHENDQVLVESDEDDGLCSVVVVQTPVDLPSMGEAQAHVQPAPTPTPTPLPEPATPEAPLAQSIPIAQPFAPIGGPVIAYSEAMESLRAMGFVDEEATQAVLAKHNGDLQAACLDLIEHA